MTIRPPSMPTPVGPALRRGLSGCALVLSAAGCELQEISLAEPDDIVIVEAILRAGEATQHVLVHRSFGLGPPPAAQVTVTDERGTATTLSQVQQGVCLIPTEEPGGPISACYAFNGRDFVLPGRSYTLRVETSDGRVLTGSTRVPGEFEILRPAAGACELPADSTYDMEWTVSDGAWVYIAEASLLGLRDALDALDIDVPADPLRIVGLSVGSADTTIVFPSEFGLFDRFDDDLGDVLVVLQDGLPPGVGATVIVGAADRNYVNWVRGGNFNPSGTVRVPSVSGAGGTGVFGSVVTRERVLISEFGANRPPC